MHTLIRPALYRAFHFVWPVEWPGEAPRFLEDPGIPNLETADLAERHEHGGYVDGMSE